MNTLAEVTTFLAQCTETLGLGFHPDTPFIDYWIRTGPNSESSVYTYAEAEEMDKKMSDAFAFCLAHGHDIYELSMETPAYKRLWAELNK